MQTRTQLTYKYLVIAVWMLPCHLFIFLPDITGMKRKLIKWEEQKKTAAPILNIQKYNFGLVCHSKGETLQLFPIKIAIFIVPKKFDANIQTFYKGLESVPTFAVWHSVQYIRVFAYIKETKWKEGGLYFLQETGNQNS